MVAVYSIPFVTIVAFVTLERVNAFSTVNTPKLTTQMTTNNHRSQKLKSQLLEGFESQAYTSPEQQNTKEREIQRLWTMARSLRAEARALEIEQAESAANAELASFLRFDANRDGEITFTELKDGLEKSMKTKIPENLVRKVLEFYDVSGDGKLQPEEFVREEEFAGRLEHIRRQEKQEAIKAAAVLKRKSLIAMRKKEIAMLKNLHPTKDVKLTSLIPYLFPMMDSVELGRFFLIENGHNAAGTMLALFCIIYNSIPFSRYIAFIALNILSTNTNTNRLVRFNVQQAIVFEIGIFFLTSFGNVIKEMTTDVGIESTSQAFEMYSTGAFAVIVLALSSAAISSCLGNIPDKIPIISDITKAQASFIDQYKQQGIFSSTLFKEDEEEREP